MAEPMNVPQQSPVRIGMNEFRSNFAGFMRQVRRGSSFIVTSGDAVVAVVSPPQSLPAFPARRQPGTLRGKIEMSSDFDETPPALLAALEGEEN